MLLLNFFFFLAQLVKELFCCCCFYCSVQLFLQMICLLFFFLLQSVCCRFLLLFTVFLYLFIFYLRVLRKEWEDNIMYVCWRMCFTDECGHQFLWLLKCALFQLDSFAKTTTITIFKQYKTKAGQYNQKLRTSCIQGERECKKIPSNLNKRLQNVFF